MMTVDQDRAGFARMDNVVADLVQICGRTPKDACIQMAWAVIRSLGAATIKRKSNMLPVQLSKSAKDAGLRRWKNIYKGKTFYTGDKIYWVERYLKDNQTKKRFVIWAPNITEARKSPSAKMRYHGLAKASWGFALANAGAQGEAAWMQFGAEGNSVLQKEVRVKEKGGIFGDYAIEIQNNLDYVAKALNGGPATVSTAIGKAMNSTEAMIKSAIHRAGKGGVRDGAIVGGWGRASRLMNTKSSRRKREKGYQ